MQRCSRQGRSWAARGFFLLALAGLSGSALAAAGGAGLAPSPGKAVAAPSLVVAPSFRVGEAFTLRLAREKHVETAGQPSSAQDSNGELRIQVLANDADGSRLECVYGHFALRDTTAPEIRGNPLMQVMTASREGLVVRLATGPRFANPQIENVEEVLLAYRGSLQKATARMPPEVAQSVQRLVAPMLANKQAFAAKLAEELFIYLQVMGADVPLQGAQLTQGYTVSPAGGAPVKTFTSLSIARLDRAANRVQLRLRQDSNPGDVQALVERVVDKARDAQPSAGDTPTPAATPAVPALRVEDTADYDIDLATGWPDTATRRRVLTMGDQVLVDTLQFTRVK